MNGINRSASFRIGTIGNVVKCTYVFVVALLALALGLAAADDSTSPAAETARFAAQDAAVGGSRAWHRITRKVHKGETLAKILRPLGVSGPESYSWFQAIQRQLPKGKLATGQTLALDFEKPPAANQTGNLRAIQLETKPAETFTWTLRNGSIEFSRRNRPANVTDRAAAASDTKDKRPPTRAKQPTKPVTQPPKKSSESRLASIERVTHIVRRGETLSKVFKRMAVPTGTAHRWFRIIARNYSVKGLRPGRRVVFYFTTQVAPNKSSRGKQTLRGLKIETKRGKFLTWQKERKQIVYRGKNFDIASTTASKSGKPPPVAAQVSEKVHRRNGHAKVPAAPPLESLHRVTRSLSKGTTFAAIARPLGVSGAESQTWFLALKKHAAGRKLGTGQKIEFYFEQPPTQERVGNLRALRIQRKQGKPLTWRLLGDHIYLGSKRVMALHSSGADKRPEVVLRRYPGGIRKLPLSEYSLARVRQRNGLLAHTHPQTGHRPTASLAALERITRKIRAGNTLLGLLKPFPLGKDEVQTWLSAIERNYIAKKLQPGTTVQLYFSKTDSDSAAEDPVGFGPLKAIEIELSGNKILIWYRSDHDDILFYKSEPPYDTEVKAVAGEITTGSLYDAAARVGLHPAVITQLVDIFGWDINFETDLRNGDTFRVLYTRRFRPGSKKPSKIRVLAAEVVNKGETHVAIYFENASGTGHYYDLNGRTVSRSFLRYPVEFRRISSNFSWRRYHPILRVRKPHRGVDFAAKRRTPVRTIGSGVVTYASWKGAYGRFIEVDHGRGLKTRYAHLHRITPGIRPGAHVRKGQIIGKVGCSGRCTGPHLHFEMWQNNRYVNPLKTEFPPDDELEPTVFNIFEEAKASFLAKLTAEPKAGDSSPTP